MNHSTQAAGRTVSSASRTNSQAPPSTDTPGARSLIATSGRSLRYGPIVTVVLPERRPAEAGHYWTVRLRTDATSRAGDEGGAAPYRGVLSTCPRECRVAWRS